ncbi:MAG TPA: prepilin-type N-terminal cleavage/methylation domain-containing protein [Armatimonadota bacterium]|jgi:prepilin-type N-terminal cleavage/methylation domain-containing protein
MSLIANAYRRRPRGFTLVELLIVITVILILAGLAIPNMLESRMAANESSAIGSMRVISKAMETYQLRNVGGNYAYPSHIQDLGALVPPELDPILASGQKSGYAFAGGGDASNYAITACPIQFGTTGRRSFFIDASGAIRSVVNNGAPATATDPVLQ